MAKPFSVDLRERIVGAVEAGRSPHEVARMFRVGASCVIKLRASCRTTRARWIFPAPGGGEPGWVRQGWSCSRRRG
jgi:transposase